jgi:hypothetical protein
MSPYSVSVLLQFPAMPLPRRINVTLRELFYLDRYSERRLAADGTAIYLPGRKPNNDDQSLEAGPWAKQ